jgi:hypothetical protein
MSQRSADQERGKRPLLRDTRIWGGPSNALLGQMRDASCGRLAARAQHGRDLAPAVEPTQADLPADHETEEEHERRVLGGQRALGLHASPELLVQPLDHVRGSECLPLPLRELEVGIPAIVIA